MIIVLFLFTGLFNYILPFMLKTDSLSINTDLACITNTSYLNIYFCSHIGSHICSLQMEQSNNSTNRSQTPTDNFLTEAEKV